MPTVKIRRNFIMKKKKWVIIGVASPLLLIFVVVGLYFSSPYILNFFDFYGDPFAKYTGIWDVDISPDDQHIVFTHYDDGIATIYIAKTDGSDIKRLTSSQTASLYRQQFSSDGSKVLFITLSKNANKPHSQLYTINIDGTEMKQIYANEKRIMEAIFSPDDQFVYFIQSKKFDFFLGSHTEHDIYSLRTDGSVLKQITKQNQFQMSDLSMTADGKKLLFQTHEDDGDRFHFLSLQNPSHIESFAPSGSFDNPIFSNLKISPNGTSIVFAAANDGDEGFEYELYTMDIVTKASKKLTNLHSSIEKPVFFHHTDRLLFMQDVNWPNEPTKYRLMQMQIDELKLIQIELDIPKTE
jgi:Tol biopolymer transport system component